MKRGLELAEGAELRRIHNTVDHSRILAPGGILHHTAQARMLAAKVKLPLYAPGEVDEIRISICASRSNHLFGRR